VTIKKRLFISNVLMFVIPFVVSVTTMLVIVFILDFLSDGAFVVMFLEGRETQAAQRVSQDIHLTLVPTIIFTSFCVIMFFTNLFLTRFVFKKIKQPLEMLSSGVHQISEGKLDYTIKYQGNDEFKPVCEAFNDMAARLKESIEEVQKNDQNRKELFAGISHDIRSPLTSIKAYVDGLLDGVAATPESQRDYLLIIKQKTDDINKMVTQLFLYSKLDMGNYPTNPETLNIGNEINDFVSASQDEYTAQGLTIEIKEIPNDTHIYADPVQLRSVFANILENSAKYKNKDAVKATINCTVCNGNINIVFEDDGAGVSESEISRLFDVFYRADLSRSNPHKGSGLGLAITAKTLERMNGKIFAENIATGGLRMIIEIPEIECKGESL
jgi:signal transduction histidine kinase